MDVKVIPDEEVAVRNQLLVCDRILMRKYGQNIDRFSEDNLSPPMLTWHFVAQ